MTSIVLEHMPWELSVCKLESRIVSEWAKDSVFLSATCTPEEYSLVCETRCVPDAVKAETGWRALKVQGILDFSLVGIIADITAALKQAAISVFVISTFDTDYILVKEDTLAAAQEVLSVAVYDIPVEQNVPANRK